MADNLCQIKVKWSIGEGTIPNGPVFAGTGGKINLDSFRYDRVVAARNDPDGTTHHVGRAIDSATMVLIRALEKDNNDHVLYPHLWYKLGDQSPTQFGDGPLMLIGSVANLVHEYHDITLGYKLEDEPLPECEAPAAAGAASKPAATTQPWPNKAILEVIIGMAYTSKKPSTSPSKY